MPLLSLPLSFLLSGRRKDLLRDGQGSREVGRRVAVLDEAARQANLLAILPIMLKSQQQLAAS